MRDAVSGGFRVHCNDQKMSNSYLAANSEERKIVVSGVGLQMEDAPSGAKATSQGGIAGNARVPVSHTSTLQYYQIGPQSGITIVGRFT